MINLEESTPFEDTINSELEIYYKRLFPFEDYYRWMSYRNQSIFQRREFTFTIIKNKKEIYIRHQSFDNAKKLEDEVRNLKPTKIHIGAMYNVRPTKPCYNNYFPTERELIFDIDINDYDDIRTCCTGDQICPKCWKFMALACKILDNGLRIDFGYNHILWVFSGRRGIHCWVCDQKARILSPSERQTVGKYFQIINGGKYTYKKVKLDNRTQYLISSALDMIRPIFVPFIVKEQDILGTNERLAKFLNVIYDAEDKEALRSQMETLETSSQRWNTFVCYIENLLDKTKKKHHKYTYLIDEIMLQYTYPRMDIKVTETMNHLLKGPFCVHPKTGKISVPFSISTVDEFSTDNVPTIETLTEEMTKIDLEEGESVENINAERKNYKTSLDPALTVFREFISNLEYDK